MAAVRSPANQPANQPANRPMAIRCARCGHLASRANGPQCFFCGTGLPGATTADPQAEHVAVAPRQRSIASVAYAPREAQVAVARPAVRYPRTPPGSPAVSAQLIPAAASRTHAAPPDATYAPYAATAPARPSDARPLPARPAYNTFAGAALLLGLVSVGITAAAAATGYYIFGYFSIYALLVALRGVLEGVTLPLRRGLLISLLGLILSGLALAATLLMATGQIVIYY